MCAQKNSALYSYRLRKQSGHNKCVILKLDDNPEQDISPPSAADLAHPPEILANNHSYQLAELVHTETSHYMSIGSINTQFHQKNPTSKFYPKKPVDKNHFVACHQTYMVHYAADGHKAPTLHCLGCPTGLQVLLQAGIGNSFN